MGCHSSSVAAILLLLLFAVQRHDEKGNACWAYSSSSTPPRRAFGGGPRVTRRAIAGLWRLTPNKMSPMKEFTVHPKHTLRDIEDADILLMLREDGSFEQYQNVDASDEESADVQVAWKHYQYGQEQEAKRKKRLSVVKDDLVKGIWDYRDGNLILAADRPEQQQQIDEKKRQAQQEKQRRERAATGSTLVKKPVDTLLVGRVVASYENSLRDNPVLLSSDAVAETGKDDSSATGGSSGLSSSSSNSNPKQSPSSTRATGANNPLDAHLSVPKGSVEVGKFFYPKKHPQFFDQPMFQPVRRGSFILRQVLGKLNTHLDEDDDEPVEKYQTRDFYNKTFLLTSHPLAIHRPKGRWSVKFNRFVEDEKTREQEEQEARQQAIRVMQVAFFKNNTFSSVAGLGDATILRGLFDVLGREKDQLWMQVQRFGFGRSVSGSVYSEGRMLTQDDAKTYWGTIKEEQPEKDKEGEDDDKKEAAVGMKSGNNGTDASSQGQQEHQQQTKRLEVKGSVMFGFGVGAEPVGRFIMREVHEMDLLDTDEEEDDDEENEEEGQLDTTSFPPDVPGAGGDGIDWTQDNAFQ